MRSVVPSYAVLCILMIYDGSYYCGVYHLYYYWYVHKKRKKETARGAEKLVEVHSSIVIDPKRQLVALKYNAANNCSVAQHEKL